MPLNGLGWTPKQAASHFRQILFVDQHIGSHCFIFKRNVIEVPIAGGRKFFVEKFSSEKLSDFG
jgi:hypothetical protein